jgi:uncharacterized protein
MRFASVDGRVTQDPARALPGRGAWLHPRPECLAAAQRRNAFARAFRSRVEGIDSTEVSWPRSASTS